MTNLTNTSTLSPRAVAYMAAMNARSGVRCFASARVEETLHALLEHDAASAAARLAGTYFDHGFVSVLEAEHQEALELLDAVRAAEGT